MPEVRAPSHPLPPAPFRSVAAAAPATWPATGTSPCLLGRSAEHPAPIAAMISIELQSTRETGRRMCVLPSGQKKDGPAARCRSTDQSGRAAVGTKRTGRGPRRHRLGAIRSERSSCERKEAGERDAVARATTPLPPLGRIWARGSPKAWSPGRTGERQCCRRAKRRPRSGCARRCVPDSSRARRSRCRGRCRPRAGSSTTGAPVRPPSRCRGGFPRRRAREAAPESGRAWRDVLCSGSRPGGTT